MFYGVAVDGSTSFVPGGSVTVDEEEEELTEDSEVQTPISITSNKRASSTSTTGSRPSKKSKSPVVRNMERFMPEFARIHAERNQLFQRHLDAKQKVTQQEEAARVETIKYVRQLAKESGVDEDSELWSKVFRISKDPWSLDWIIHTSTLNGRLNFIKN